MWSWSGCPSESLRPHQLPPIKETHLLPWSPGPGLSPSHTHQALTCGTQPHRGSMCSETQSSVDFSCRGGSGGEKHRKRQGLYMPSEAQHLHQGSAQLCERPGNSAGVSALWAHLLPFTLHLHDLPGCFQAQPLHHTCHTVCHSPDETCGATLCVKAAALS